MNEITSTEFRKTYHTLKEPTVVTVNGHRIGVYKPVWNTLELDQPDDEPIALLTQDGAEHGPLWNAKDRKAAQQKRDALLRKVNRK